VVVTRAFTKTQWKREYEALTTIKPVILDGTTGSEIPKDARTIILNWEILPAWTYHISEWHRGGYLSVIFDEIHRAKNWRRKEKYVQDDGTTAWRDLDNITASAAKLRAKRRLGLTATPIPNSLSDLWSQLDLIEPGCWGTNWEFVHRYCAAKPGKHGGLDTSGRSNVEELRARLREVCHVVKYDEMSRSLPKKRRQLCYISPAEQSAPAAFSRDMQRAARLGPEALFETRLMEAASRKRKWVKEIVEEHTNAGRKVCVITGRRRECEDLADMLSKLKDLPVWWGHGEDPIEARLAAVRSYREHQGAACFVGTIDAFGEAIDGLQCTDVAVCAMIPYTTGKIVQLEGRWDRIGRTGPLLILYPIAEGTVDEHVADLLKDKLENVYAVTKNNNVNDIANALSGSEDEESIMRTLLSKMMGNT